jgi:hypothetical protein
MGQGLVIAETSHAVIIIALQRMTNKIIFLKHIFKTNIYIHLYVGQRNTYL